jgi:hypothetical protein
MSGALVMEYTHHLSHLEYVDAIGFAATTALVHSQGKHENFKLVRTSQFGTRINIIKQI